MKCVKFLSIFLILLVIILSLVILVNPQANIAPDYSKSPFISVPFALRINFNQDSPFLNQSTRMQIYNFIKNNPGVNFRGICNYLNMPIGVVQYHTAVLTKAGLISTRRDGRNKRYFESKKFSSTEMEIISILRHRTAGKILTILKENRLVSHKNLAQRLKISSQALTWHVKRLKEMGRITSLVDGTTIKYLLDEATLATVKRCINLINNG